MNLPNRTFIKLVEYASKDIVSANMSHLSDLVFSLDSKPINNAGESFKEVYNKLQKMHRLGTEVYPLDGLTKLRDHLCYKLEELLLPAISNILNVSNPNNPPRPIPMNLIRLKNNKVQTFKQTKAAFFLSPFPFPYSKGSGGEFLHVSTVPGKPFEFCIALNFILPYNSLKNVLLHELTHLLQCIKKDVRYTHSEIALTKDQYREHLAEIHAEMNRAVYFVLNTHPILDLVKTIPQVRTREILVKKYGSLIDSLVPIIKHYSSDKAFMPEILTNWDDDIAKETINEWIMGHPDEMSKVINYYKEKTRF